MKIDREEFKVVIQLYEVGYSTTEIAKLYSASSSSILARLKRAGVKIRSLSEARMDSKYDFAVHLYQQGYTTDEIAAVFGVTRSAIGYGLRRRGVVFRGQLRGKDHPRYSEEKTGHEQAIQQRVLRLINKGIITPEPCEVCCCPVYDGDGKRIVDAHHDDYNKPLVIRWLCHKHHTQWHHKNKPIRVNEKY